MRITETVTDCREAIAAWTKLGDDIGLVPTMGALHEGHLSLIRAARSQCARVAVTIFVNPAQFGDPEDLARYPVDIERDIALLRAEGVDLLFQPRAEEIYPPGDETIVETTRLANMLHGEVRPGHFRGVTTVVARLFNIIQARAAFFGEKDYQQLQIIRRMVRDLHIPIEVIAMPTQRESDGLAMSSRNVRLTPQDRAAAVVLNKSLCMAERLVAEGVDVDELHRAIVDHIRSEPRADLKAVDIVEAQSLAPITGKCVTPIAIMLSAAFGEVLLIDQREIYP